MQTTASVSAFPAEDSILRELHALGFGQTIGRYTLVRRVAAGGMAEVYVARTNSSAGLGKRVAIKKILPQYSHNERFVQMLVDEAKITVSLAHPNIAQVFELAIDGDYFIVMELVDGPPLAKLIVRNMERGGRGLPIELAVHVVSEVARGLDHAHKQTAEDGTPLGIIHRDVSPQNILISRTGAVKLIDFGIARAAGRAAKTAQGVIKGKLRYLAPEIANGEEPDWRADIYCCGIVLFEALTGVPMFSPTSDVEALAMAANGCVRSPRSINPDIPEELDRIVMRAVALERRDRYNSARELAQDLRVFLNRQYPTFVESALAEFVQDMFAKELEKDQNLDAVSEKHLRRSTPLRSSEDAKTVAEVKFPDRTYRKLVTAPVAPPPQAQPVPAQFVPGQVTQPRVGQQPQPPPLPVKPPPLPISIEERPALSLHDTIEEMETLLPPPVEESSAEEAPTRVRRSHADIQSQLTDLGSIPDELIEFSDSSISAEGFVHDTAVPDGGESFAEEERSFSEELELDDLVVEDTAPSVSSRAESLEDLRPDELTDWRPKRFQAWRSNFQAWRSKAGTWSVGQIAVVLGCFAIGGVSLAIASVSSSDSDAEPAIVIPAAPAAVVPSTDAVKQAAVVAVLPPVEVRAEDLAAAAAEEDAEDAEEEVAPRGKLAVLKIKAFPSSAIIVDGKKRGMTPKTVHLKPGTHKIVLQAPDGSTREINRWVGRGKNLPVNVYW